MKKILFKFRLIIGLVLLLVGTYYLFYDGPGYTASRSTKELWNLGHIVYFALTIYLLAKLQFLQKVPLPYQWLGFLMLSLFWGTLIEVLQYGTTRIPDLADIFRDMTGCLLVLSFHPALLKLSSAALLLVIRLSVSIVVTIQLIPLAVAVVDETTARYQFPVLSNFATPFEIDRWDGGAGKEVVQLDPESGSFQLKIGLTTTTYSGVGMQYLPSDWSHYNSVNLKIFNPSTQSLGIVIRIHDAKHLTGPVAYAYSDRFNTRLNLKEGWNDIAIPLSKVESAPHRRKMDLSQIRDVSLFVSRLPEPRVIYLDKIYLAN